jgi:hypothetical protein
VSVRVTPGLLAPIVRKGSTRVVLVLGPRALKFARSERGGRCSGQALAYVYFEDEPGRRAAAKLLTARRRAPRGTPKAKGDIGHRHLSRRLSNRGIGSWSPRL